VWPDLTNYQQFNLCLLKVRPEFGRLVTGTTRHSYRSICQCLLARITPTLVHWMDISGRHSLQILAKGYEGGYGINVITSTDETLHAKKKGAPVGAPSPKDLL
jgi:hypothetical protein